MELKLFATSGCIIDYSLAVFSRYYRYYVLYRIGN